MMIKILLLLLATVAAGSLALPQLCTNAQGMAVAVSNSSCPAGTAAFSAAGVNIYDLLWDAQAQSTTAATLHYKRRRASDPDPQPEPPGNMQSSLAALNDAAAYNFTLIRFFAAPWSYDYDWRTFNSSQKEAYFQPMDEVMQRAEVLGLHLVPSLGYGCADDSPCNPAHITNETFKQYMTDAGSQTRAMVFAYATDFVARYANSSAVLFWELGNELNLFWDKCFPTAGNMFRMQDGLGFVHDYRNVVLAADPHKRIVNTGFSAPRPQSYHMSLIEDPCNSPSPAMDSVAQTIQMFEAYSNDFQLLTMHSYGCNPPDGPYAYCNGSTDMTLVKLAYSVSVAVGKPFYFGEFGATNWGADDGYNATGSPGFDYAVTVLETIGNLQIPLSTLWAYECPSHGDTPNWCLHPGLPSHQNSTYLFSLLLQLANVRLYDPSFDANNTGTLVLLPGLPQSSAACLDGSPYGYYVRPGRRRDAWVIEIEGGGWAFNLDEAASRANTTLGSSKQWTPTLTLGDYGPRFAGFSRAYFPYCDGSSFTGSVSHPVPSHLAPPPGLYFRGHDNLIAALRDIRQRFVGASAAVEELIVTGGSAGGLSTIIHVDEMQEILGAKQAVGVPVAGYFLAHDAPCSAAQACCCNYTGAMYGVYNLYNSSAGVDRDCLAANPSPSQAWQCLLAPFTINYTQAPVFFLQSKFDHWQLSEEAGVPCSFQQAYTPPWQAAPTCSAADTAVIKSYGQEFMTAFNSAALQGPGSHRACFLTSCVLHGIDVHFASVAPAINFVSGFAQWYFYRNVQPSISPVDFRFIEDEPLPRTDNPLACPPFIFTQ